MLSSQNHNLQTLAAPGPVIVQPALGRCNLQHFLRQYSPRPSWCPKPCYCLSCS